MDLESEFNRIITPVDGSDNSIKAAKKGISIAKKLDLEVLSIFVFNDTSIKNILTPNHEYEKFENAIEEEAQNVLNKIEENGRESDVKIFTMILKGNPSEKIIEEANEDDLIVMGSKGKSAVDRVFIGSISEKVMHYSDADVMIVK